MAGGKSRGGRAVPGRRLELAEMAIPASYGVIRRGISGDGGVERALMV